MKYLVGVATQKVYHYEVEADSEDEAMEMAEDMYCDDVTALHEELEHIDNTVILEIDDEPVDTWE